MGREKCVTISAMNKANSPPVFSLVRIFANRPRLVACAILGVLVGYLIPPAWASQLVSRLIIGWNAGVLVYLVLAMYMMFGSTHARMRTRAMQPDEGRVLILALVVASAIATLAAIVYQLAAVKDMHGTARYVHIALAVCTLVTSWTFTQTMFGLHYAHEYYTAEAHRKNGGLDFPGGQAPDYADFLYFSCVIGTSGQTADVAFTSRSMRRTGLVHCVLAYFFNATLLALTINIASGLL